MERLQIHVHVEGEPVERTAAAHAQAERGDLGLADVHARRAVAATRNGRIGVISTLATKTSRSYEDAVAAVPNVKLFTQACPRFVEFVEDGVTGGDELIKAAHEYLDPIAA